MPPLTARASILPAMLLGLIVAAPALRAETYRFAPAVFSSTLSRAHPPALRIASGDRVITATVDDTGADATGAARTSGRNPQTGPFYVEGAEPGDLLVVTIETLEPNRTTGVSTSTIASGAVAHGALSGRPDETRFPWTIDRAQRVVRLDLSAALPGVRWSTRFASPVFEMPLRPTLGAIAVAPAGDAAVDTEASGPFGGNLQSVAIAAGARVMLPVLQPGALLFLGHGHARQGDGAVTGTGIETSLEVAFRVEVVKKQAWPHSSVVRPSTVVGEFAMGWPRVETADMLMAIGSAPTLQAALQHATLELHRWLDDDFGLSEKSVSLFVGQAIEYEIASLVEPHFTVVAKVRKAYLPKAVPVE
jgi:amidase